MRRLFEVALLIVKWTKWEKKVNEKRFQTQSTVEYSFCCFGSKKIDKEWQNPFSKEHASFFVSFKKLVFIW